MKVEKKVQNLKQILQTILYKTQNISVNLQEDFLVLEEKIEHYLNIHEYYLSIEKGYLSFIIMESYKKNIQNLYEKLFSSFQNLTDNIQKNDRNYFTETYLSFMTNGIKENINKTFENNNIDDIINNEINAILIRHANGNLKFSCNIIEIRKDIYEIVKKQCENIEIHIKQILENEVMKIKELNDGKIKPQKKVKTNFLRVFRYGFLTCSVVIGSMIIFQMYSLYEDTKKTEQVLSGISTKVNLNNKELNIMPAKEVKTEIQKLKEMNPDAVSWIEVKGTNINHSVVKTNNNEYYLDHNFYKEYSENGWAFMDYRNSGNFHDKNTIIYAHNSAPMFSSLKNTLNNSWFKNKENHFITTLTEEGTQTWQVFSTYVVKVEDYYIQTKFTGNEFQTFVNVLKNRSVFNYGVEVTGDDQILTLSTCNKGLQNGRTVLHAKLVK